MKMSLFAGLSLLAMCGLASPSHAETGMFVVQCAVPKSQALTIEYYQGDDGEAGLTMKYKRKIKEGRELNEREIYQHVGEDTDSKDSSRLVSVLELSDGIFTAVGLGEKNSSKIELLGLPNTFKTVEKKNQKKTTFQVLVRGEIGGKKLPAGLTLECRAGLDH